MERAIRLVGVLLLAELRRLLTRAPACLCPVFNLSRSPNTRRISACLNSHEVLARVGGRGVFFPLHRRDDIKSRCFGKTFISSRLPSAVARISRIFTRTFAPSYFEGARRDRPVVYSTKEIHLVSTFTAILHAILFFPRIPGSFIINS